MILYSFFIFIVYNYTNFSIILVLEICCGLLNLIKKHSLFNTETAKVSMAMFTLEELPIVPHLPATASNSTSFELKPLRSSAFPSVLSHVKSSVNFQPAPSPKHFPRQRTLSDSASHSSPRLRRQRTLKGGFPATAAELETISPANEETCSLGARSQSETDLSCRSEFLTAAQRAAEQAEEVLS